MVIAFTNFNLNSFILKYDIKPSIFSIQKQP